MGQEAIVFALVVVQVISLSFLQTAAAAERDVLAPLLAPLYKDLCNAVECGRGTCRPSSNGTFDFGYVCECNPGWTKLHIGDHLQFLPCVIPNCTIDYACFNATAPIPLPPPPSPKNHSFFDPCTWTFCGEGGTCVKTSDFGHRCDCKAGYDNLLNVTTFPCFKDCALGADCARLGIGLPTGSSSPSSSPNLSGRSTNRASTTAPQSLPWLFLLTIFLAIIHKA